MAAKKKVVFMCDSCGGESPKWYGRCPVCGEWDTLKEMEALSLPEKVNALEKLPTEGEGKPLPLSQVPTDDEIRFSTGMSELNRVLGGGAVKGSLVLIGGEPGIGKSTLMLQISESLAKLGKVLYASGEESRRQLKLRADRLGVSSDQILLLSETSLEHVLAAVEQTKPAVLVVDSIQTIYRAGNAAAPGNLAQIRECTMALLRLAKSTGIIVFVVGHVNKEGEIAGPKILEHMVDCVLYFEGEMQSAYRILRAAKNRFGSTNEIGVFEMAAAGLVQVPNPSAALLAGRPDGVPGSCITCTMEGTRPVLAEIQALVVRTAYGNPRRTASGIDYNRAVLLLAVLEKRAGLAVSNADVYINVVGGLRIDEPAADLAAVVALASSVREKPVRSDTVVFGEVGLTGELRRVIGLEQRFAEAARLSISRCVCPALGSMPVSVPQGLEIVRVSNIREAIAACLVNEAAE